MLPSRERTTLSLIRLSRFALPAVRKLRLETAALSAWTTCARVMSDYHPSEGVA
jgi:hypothetical protein